MRLLKAYTEEGLLVNHNFGFLESISTNIFHFMMPWVDGASCHFVIFFFFFLFKKISYVWKMHFLWIITVEFFWVIWYSWFYFSKISFDFIMKLDMGIALVCMLSFHVLCGCSLSGRVTIISNGQVGDFCWSFKWPLTNECLLFGGCFILYWNNYLLTLKFVCFLDCWFKSEQACNDDLWIWISTIIIL